MALILHCLRFLSKNGKVEKKLEILGRSKKNCGIVVIIGKCFAGAEEKVLTHSQSWKLDKLHLAKAYSR